MAFGDRGSSSWVFKLIEGFDVVLSELMHLPQPPDFSPNMCKISEQIAKVKGNCPGLGY